MRLEHVPAYYTTSPRSHNRQGVCNKMGAISYALMDVYRP